MRHVSLTRIFVLGVLGLVFAASGAQAQDDAYFDLPIDHLTLTDGKLPHHGDDSSTRFERGRMMSINQIGAYVALDGTGDAYATWFDEENWRGKSEQGHLFIHTPDHRDVTGRLYIDNADGTGMVQVKFKVSGAAADPAAKDAFFQAMDDHYIALLRERGTAGAAWFRYRQREARQALGKKEEDPTNSWASPAESLDETFSLFSGDQAMAENLQLDKALPLGAAKPGETEVDVDSIKGITVAEMDWKNLIKDKNPALDPLAAAIPGDQHAIFLSSVQSLMEMSDEADRNGGTLMQIGWIPSQDAATGSRYEKQLGVPLKGLAQLLGPQLVGSVAITGSDPYLRAGTDVAILLESKNTKTLFATLQVQLDMARRMTPGAEEVFGHIGNLTYRGDRSPDRGLCSYIAAVNGGVVVLTNSLEQLARLAAVQDGKVEALSKAPEYIFFRDRYKLGDENETGLLVLSDATIRRWCGPRWRIADSRRTRAAALMSDLDAKNMDALVAGTIKAGPVTTEFTVPGMDDLQMMPGGAMSQSYGSLGFLTPICEMKIDKATAGEATAYQQWRDSYERNWRGIFDPIAVRFQFSQKKLAADLTVMPLILGSEFLPMEHIMVGAKIDPAGGDPHDCLLRAAMSINVNSAQVRMASMFVSQIAPDIKIDPFSWVGQSISYYVDDDPFWAAAGASTQPDQYFQTHLDHLPVALRVEVSDGFKLAAFLVAAHAYIDQSAPGMTLWENLKYKDQPYVKISPTEQARANSDELKDASLYYRASGDGLLLTLNEAMLKRAIDRQLEREEAKKAGKTLATTQPAILGDNLIFQADGHLYDVFNRLGNTGFQILMQGQSWRNLAILNEWKRRYPDQDPQKLYERFFHQKLVDPGAGEYVWNEQWQTMESTVYGSPAQPKEGPVGIAALKSILRANFGVTFEHDGLRGRTELERQ